MEQGPPEAGHRTFIATVVFIDIVGYSERLVTQQVELKTRLNGLVADVLQNVAASDHPGCRDHGAVAAEHDDHVGIDRLACPVELLTGKDRFADKLYLALPEPRRKLLRGGFGIGIIRLHNDPDGRYSLFAHLMISSRKTPETRRFV